MKRLLLILIAGSLLFSACPDPYDPGGAEDTTEQRDMGAIAETMAPMSGVWNARDGKYLLDGYRIGLAKNLKTEMADKLDMFPDFDPDRPSLHHGTVRDEDYYLFYDDSSYGVDPATGKNYGYAYMGIVMAVNVFNEAGDAGAVIIEYLDGCYPRWEPKLERTPLPFFGMYYRINAPDRIQMANPVDLDALEEGRPYYTETATLGEAVAKNTPENDPAFIYWNIVYPQQPWEE
jgi:hypothetical protein